jgi:hypothetical protein
MLLNKMKFREPTIEVKLINLRAYLIETCQDKVALLVQLPLLSLRILLINPPIKCPMAESEALINE